MWSLLLGGQVELRDVWGVSEEYIDVGEVVIAIEARVVRLAVLTGEMTFVLSSLRRVAVEGRAGKIDCSPAAALYRPGVLERFLRCRFVILSLKVRAFGGGDVVLADHTECMPSDASRISVTSEDVPSLKAKPLSSADARVKLLRRGLLRSRFLVFEGEGKMLRLVVVMVPAHDNVFLAV